MKDCGLPIHSAFESADGHKMVAVPCVFFPGKDDGSPEFKSMSSVPGGAEVEILRHDADDIVLFPVEPDLPADDPRVCAVTALPEDVADDDHPVAGFLLLILGKPSFHGRHHRIGAQDAGRAGNALHPQRLAVAEIEDAGFLHTGVFEGGVLLTNIEIIRPRERLVASFGYVGFPYLDQAIRLRIVERLHQQGLEHAEDRHARAAGWVWRPPPGRRVRDQ